MEFIQSVKNTKVKEWRKLHSKKYRDRTNAYLIEGVHLVEEALKTDDVVEIIVQENFQLPPHWETTVPLLLVSAEVLKHIATTETPQGIIAVCKKRLNTIDLNIHKRILLMDQVQDPGNIGTMIRTADAAGMDAVILGEGCGDLYNPKVIRSAQGSHFHVHIMSGSILDWMKMIRNVRIPIFGTALEHAVQYEQVESQEQFALIMGNEGAGVAPEILSETDQNLYIPLLGQSESLNVAVATGILLYHLRKL